MKLMENLSMVMFSHMNTTDKKCNKFIHLHPLEISELISSLTDVQPGFEVYLSSLEFDQPLSRPCNSLQIFPHYAFQMAILILCTFSPSLFRLLG